MIESFVASWALFHHAYMAGWLLAALLGTIGVVVVARDQIFLGAAVAQASTLGIALGMVLAPLLASTEAGEHALLLTGSSLFAVLASWISSRLRQRGDSYEAVTGWIFLASSSLAILAMASSPHGLEEVHRLLASTLIGASGADVLLLTSLLAATGMVVARERRRILLFVMEPAMAEAVGVRAAVWSPLLAIWLGLVVAQAIRISGTLYAFGCLLLPALAAKSLSREALPLFWMAPLGAVAASFVGFVSANHYDLPPAQVTVAVLAGLVALGWCLRR